MYQLVHLSDLHYDTSNREKVRALLDAAVERNPDHLIISGDLTADGRAFQFRGLRDLLWKSGFSGNRLTVVPGNHDMYGFIYQTFSHPCGVLGGIKGVHSLKLAVKRLWRYKERLTRFGEEDYRESLYAFFFHFEDTFDGSLTVEGSRCGFPFVKLLPHNIALIGVDTNYLQPRLYHLFNLLRRARRVARTHDITLLGENLSGSTGAVELHALEKILTMRQVQKRRKILVLHHCLYPLNYLLSHVREAYAKEMRLTNQPEVSELLQRHGVDLVLHGHKHSLDHYRLPNGLQVLNGGGTMGEGFFGIEVTGKTLGIRRILPDQPTGHFHAYEEPVPLE